MELTLTYGTYSYQWYLPLPMVPTLTYGTLSNLWYIHPTYLLLPTMIPTLTYGTYIWHPWS